MSQNPFRSPRLARHDGDASPPRAAVMGDSSPLEATPTPLQSSKTVAPNWSSRTLRRGRKDPPIAAMARNSTLPSPPTS